MGRIRRLYRRRPPGAAVICFDEWGPLKLKPLGGMAWARRRQPRRMRATYHRRKGTEQFLGFYDVHADCLSGLFRRRKRLPELFDAFRRLRRCYPGRRLFVIMDNSTGPTTTRASLRCCGAFASSPCGLRPKRRDSMPSKRTSGL